jgi:hypothetical protein
MSPPEPNGTPTVKAIATAPPSNETLAAEGPCGAIVAAR